MFERRIELNNLIWTFNDRKQEKWVRCITDDVFESLFVLDYSCNSLIGSDGIICAISTIGLTAIFILTSFGANCSSFIFFGYKIIILYRDIELRVFICLLGDVNIPDHRDCHYLKSNTNFLATFFGPIHISNEHIASFLSETELFELLLNNIVIVGKVLLEAFKITLVVQIQVKRL